jgi:murein DD-endopeptidase MepM/ murein hydrolase activator NlpD
LPEAVGQAAGEGGAAIMTVSLEEPGDPTAVPSSLDPKWNSVNQWLSDILSAQQLVDQATGVLVPTNVIKTIIMIETGGIMPSGANYAGAAGLMQITPMTIGANHYDFARLRVDPGYSIYAGTYELALRYLDSGQRPWENVAVGYFSGHYDPTGAADAFNSDHDYLRLFRTYIQELELAGQGAPVGPGTGAGVASIWGNILIGGAPPPLTQPFGPTDFSVNVHPEWYSYSLAYGFSSPGHTGLDVGIPANTPLYAPLDSKVICAGTDNGTGEDSCAAFVSAYGGQTSGRLQLKLPNGDMLILGHVNRSLVRPGDQVKAGQQVGLSGGFNGDHVHVEYRTPDPRTTSQWRIIDPHEPLDGVSINPLPTEIGMPEVTPMPPPTDRDGDGLTDDREAALGTNPDHPDSDNDGLRDGDEITWGANPLDNDSDDDGLSDGVEVNQYRSDPLKTDSDGDTLPDADEVNRYSTDPAKPDTDDDGLKDQDELTLMTDPLKPDTEGDGLNDGAEVAVMSDPHLPDTDGDGLTDGDEVNRYRSNPTLMDTDGDGLPDANEVNQHHTDPANPDTDGDGVNDHDETVAGTDPTMPDDGGTPVVEASPVVTLPDRDGDGLTDQDELTVYLTNPDQADTDQDGTLDGAEVLAGSNPLDPLSVPNPGSG